MEQKQTDEVRREPEAPDDDHQLGVADFCGAASQPPHTFIRFKTTAHLVC
jgi:hypothetical protein